MDNSLAQIAKKISVVIAGRNNDKFVEACLLSIIQQNLSPLEVIYVNDGSTDKTKDILKSFENLYPLLKIATTIGLGISKARNLGNSMTSGDYIAVLDSDDIYLPDTIMEYSKHIALHDPDIIYADCSYVTENGHKLGMRTYPIFACNKKFARAILSFPQVPFKHSALLYKKLLVHKFGGYDESLKQKVDIELLLRFLLVGNAKFDKLNFEVVRFTKHTNQISQIRIRALPIWYSLIAKYEPNFFVRIVLFSIRSLSEFGKFLVELKDRFSQK